MPANGGLVLEVSLQIGRHVAASRRNRDRFTGKAFCINSHADDSAPRIWYAPNEVIRFGMGSTRIVRRWGRLGRRVIVKELRNAFGLDRHAQWAWAVDGDLKVRERPDLRCVFCGTTEHVIPHRGKGLCVDCVHEVCALVSGGS